MLIFGACTTDAGGPEPGKTRELTCAVLTESNCWKTALAEVAACAPADSVQGDLDTATRMCHYADGKTVDLTATQASEDSLDQRFDFELRANGELCLDVRMPEQNRWELTTASGTVIWQWDETVRLTCPDGTVYAANQFDVLGCDSGSNNRPGWFGTISEDTSRFAIWGAGETTDFTHAYECWDEPWEL